LQFHSLAVEEEENNEVVGELLAYVVESMLDKNGITSSRVSFDPEEPFGPSCPSSILCISQQPIAGAPCSVNFVVTVLLFWEGE
jgi:hypothetical protein